jgi:hypothetical protein
MSTFATPEAGLAYKISPILRGSRLGYTDERRGSPFDTKDHWEGYRTYRPERPRGWRDRDLPERFTIDKPGKCEVQCVREGRNYKCKEYRC